MIDETTETAQTASSPKVVSLSGREIPDPTQPNAGLVQLLEHILLDAKAGRLRSAAICGIDAQGQVLTQWNSEHTLLLVAGLAELLKHNLFLAVFSAGARGK